MRCIEEMFLTMVCSPGTVGLKDPEKQWIIDHAAVDGQDFYAIKSVQSEDGIKAALYAGDLAPSEGLRFPEGFFNLQSFCVEIYAFLLQHPSAQQADAQHKYGHGQT